MRPIGPRSAYGEAAPKVGIWGGRRYDGMGRDPRRTLSSRAIVPVRPSSCPPDELDSHEDGRAGEGLVHTPLIFSLPHDPDPGLPPSYRPAGPFVPALNFMEPFGRLYPVPVEAGGADRVCVLCGEVFDARKQTIAGLGEVDAAQEDGGLPTTFPAGSAPGESGVSVLKVRFHGGMHFTAAPRRHSSAFKCPIEYRTPHGRWRAAPRGAGWVRGDVLPGWTALRYRRKHRCVASRSTRNGSRLRRRGQGARSPARRVPVRLRPGALQSCLHPGAGERSRLPNQQLFWNEVASGFLANLVARHTSGSPSRHEASSANTCSIGSETMS